MRQHYNVDVSWQMALHFTKDTFHADNTCLLDIITEGQSLPLERPRRCLVFIDDGVAQADPKLISAIHSWFSHYGDQGIHLAAIPQIVEGGEKAKKDLRVAERVGQSCLEHGICRHSFVIIIGGGATLDAIGLGASLVHRGVRQIRMPSTVLAQGDAGLGVKNGVNSFGNKNFFGTFQPPWAIINDAALLQLCPLRERRSGLAEAVKVSLIKDGAFFGWLAANAKDLLNHEKFELLQYAIQRCAELHLEHITTSGDPFEMGSSRPLDFGHWSAHYLEVLSESRLNHGEAVAIGLAIDCCYAEHLGRISKAECDTVLDCLETLGFVLWDEVLNLRDSNGMRSIYKGLDQFREHLGGDLTLAMPQGIGQRSDIHAIDLSLCEQSIRRLKRRHLK